jgi:ribosomal protein S18 acetylase RimI-like enzyme
VIDLRPTAAVDADWLVDVLARWAYEAGSPYEDWRFGGPEAARTTLATWISRASSEVAAARWRVAFLADEPQGGFAALTAGELAAARRADLLALVSLYETHDLRKRLEAVADLFVPIEPDDLYLSRIAVDRASRAAGIGRALLEAVAEQAREAGAAAVRADVSATNVAGLALFRRAGFESIAERTSSEAGLSYRAVRLAL